MRLVHKYGQTYLEDLHPGDLIPDGAGGYVIVTEPMIGEDGRLITYQRVSNKISPDLPSDAKID